MPTMQNFTSSPVLIQVLILFILLMAGFFARRTKVIDGPAIKGMTSLIIKLTLPAMIIDSMATQAFSVQTLGESGLILAISFAVYAVLFLLAIPLSKIFRSPNTDVGVIRFLLVFSNVGFMGFPVVDAVFGKEALFYTAIYNLPFNLLVFTIGVIMLLRGHGGKSFSLSWKHLVSPVIISIIAGYVLFLFQLKLPAPAAKAISLAGSVTTPLSMILIGAMLAGTSIRKTLGDWRLYVISAFRLIIWPLAVFFVLRLFTDNFYMAAIPALITAMPGAANTALLANEYGANEHLASQGVFITTLLSVITIPIIAAIITAST